jgi:hypothetical protein
MHFVLIAVSIFLAFVAGIWLSPVVRGDYGAFKAYVDSKLKAAEQAAKDRL